MPMSARISTGVPASISSNSNTWVWPDANARSTDALDSSSTSRVCARPSMVSSPLRSTPLVMRQRPGATFQPVIAAFAVRAPVLCAMTLNASREGAETSSATVSACASSAAAFT